MKIEYQGAVYDFDFARLSVEECEEIEKFTGSKGLGDWSNQLGAANTKALQAAWWAIRRHAGEDPGPIGRDPSLLPLALNAAIAAAEKAEIEAAAEPEPEPDPTTAAAGSPAPAPAADVTELRRG